MPKHPGSFPRAAQRKVTIVEFLIVQCLIQGICKALFQHHFNSPIRLGSLISDSKKNIAFRRVNPDRT